MFLQTENQEQLPNLGRTLKVDNFYLEASGELNSREEKILSNWYAAHNKRGGWINRNRINTVKMEKYARETVTSGSNPRTTHVVVLLAICI